MHIFLSYLTFLSNYNYPLFNSTPDGLTAIILAGGGHLYMAIPAFRNPQYNCSSFSGIPVFFPL